MNNKVGIFVITVSLVALGSGILVQQNFFKDKNSAEELVAPAAKPIRDLPGNQKITMARDSMQQAVIKSVQNLMSGGNSASLSEGQMSPMSIEELIACITDESAPLKLRRSAAWQLAKTPDQDVLFILENLLSGADTPPYLKAAIAEALGLSGLPSARKLIVAALDDEDEIVRRGAVRGLAHLNDFSSAEILKNILLETGIPIGVRMEAARSIGSMDFPGIYDFLVNTFWAERSHQEGLDLEILAGLGRRDFSETAPFFQAVMDSTAANDGIRAEAIRVLEDARGNVAPFLLQYAVDKDPAATIPGRSVLTV